MSHRPTLLAHLWLMLSLILLPLAPGQVAAGGHAHGRTAVTMHAGCGHAMPAAASHASAPDTHAGMHHTGTHHAAAQQAAAAHTPCCCERGCDHSGPCQGHCSGHCCGTAHGVVALPSVQLDVAMPRHAPPEATLAQFCSIPPTPSFRPPIA